MVTEDAIYTFFSNLMGGVNETLGYIFNLNVHILGLPLHVLLMGCISLFTIIGTIVDIMEN